MGQPQAALAADPGSQQQSAAVGPGSSAVHSQACTGGPEPLTACMRSKHNTIHMPYTIHTLHKPHKRPHVEPACGGKQASSNKPHMPVCVQLPCLGQCSEASFCSQACARRHWEAQHCLLCRGPCDSPGDSGLGSRALDPPEAAAPPRQWAPVLGFM